MRMQQGLVFLCEGDCRYCVGEPQAKRPRNDFEDVEDELQLGQLCGNWSRLIASSAASYALEHFNASLNNLFCAEKLLHLDSDQRFALDQSLQKVRWQLEVFLPKTDGPN